MLLPSAMAETVVSANASAMPAQKSNFMNKTPPAEVVKGRKRRQEWSEELAARISTLSRGSIQKIAQEISEQQKSGSQ
jgi:hypothetical protein